MFDSANSVRFLEKKKGPTRINIVLHVLDQHAVYIFPEMHLIVGVSFGTFSCLLYNDVFNSYSPKYHFLHFCLQRIFMCACIPNQKKLNTLIMFSCCPSISLTVCLFISL